MVANGSRQLAIRVITSKIPHIIIIMADVSPMEPPVDPSNISRRLSGTPFLKLPSGVALGIYASTSKSLQLLKALGHDLKLLPGVPKGIGAEIYNTNVLVQAIKIPNYYALLYPQFPKEKPYIIPDALMILKEEHRYQLNFMEIEAEKPNWEDHLQTKYDGYKRLAKDMAVYNYWKAYSGYLKLPCPPVEKFKFRVMIIGSVKKDWGKGFEFRSTLA